jgi:hypothetical protein
MYQDQLRKQHNETDSTRNRNRYSNWLCDAETSQPHLLLCPAAADRRVISYEESIRAHVSLALVAQ